MKLPTHTFIKSLSAFVLALMMHHTAFSQISPEFYARDLSNLNNIKTTYLVVENVKSGWAQKYFAVLKDVWKLSKNVEMIDKNTVFAKMSRDALFIYPKNSDRYFYWCLTQDAADHQAKLIKEKGETATLNPNYIEYYHTEAVKHRMSVATFGSLETYQGAIDSSAFETDPRYTIAWGDGFFKNRLQTWQNFVAKYAKPGTTRSDKKDMARDMKIYVDKAQMDLVKKQTLYLPDYLTGTRDKTNLPEPDQEDAKKMMLGYKHKWAMIRSVDLNSKILNEKTPFYYVSLLGVDGLGTFFQIINSKTGELAYSHYYGTEFDKNLDSGMLRKLSDDTE